MQTANVNVPVKVTGRHVSVTEPMKDHATSRIEHLHLDYPRIVEAHVILDVEKHRHFAEIILHCANHITIEASHTTDDMYASIDGVVAKIAQQMRKYKTKILKSHRPRGTQSIRHIEEQVLHINEETFHEIENSEPEVIKTEKYPVKPMYVDEAVLQIKMSDRQFVVFQNAKTEKVNILYRRKDNGFGLIEPAFA
jgi:putative sigma-54 modulation protein